MSLYMLDNGCRLKTYWYDENYFFHWFPRSCVGTHTCFFAYNTIYYLYQHPYAFPRRAWEPVKSPPPPDFWIKFL